MTTFESLRLSVKGYHLYNSSDLMTCCKIMIRLHDSLQNRHTETQVTILPTCLCMHAVRTHNLLPIFVQCLRPTDFQHFCSHIVADITGFVDLFEVNYNLTGHMFERAASGK